MILCGNCGSLNDDHAAYCYACGDKLLELGGMKPSPDLEFENFYKDFQELKRQAANGRADAQYELGMRNLDEKYIPRDTGAALRLLRRAALQGHAEARFQLGMLLQHLGSDWQSQLWLALAARQGHQEAQYQLGCAMERTPLFWKRSLMLFELCLVKGCYQRAIDCYVAAAGNGHAEAMTRLGEIYLNGQLGVASDYVEALRWLLMADKAGSKRGSVLLRDRRLASLSATLMRG